MNIYQPYVYIIRWTNVNKGYIGARYAKGCNPSDLFVSYYTSSKYVRQLISEFGLPDQIKIFPYPDRETALLMETKFQRRFRVLESEYWLNRNINGTGFIHATERTIEHRNKLSVSMKNRKWKPSAESKKAMGAHALGKPRPEYVKEKIRSAQIGRKLSPEHNLKNSISHRSPIIYNFTNGEQQFTGTRYDFISKYDLDKTCVHRLINKKVKSHKGWFLS